MDSLRPSLCISSYFMFVSVFVCVGAPMGDSVVCVCVCGAVCVDISKGMRQLEKHKSSINPLFSSLLIYTF